MGEPFASCATRFLAVLACAMLTAPTVLAAELEDPLDEGQAPENPLRIPQVDDDRPLRHRAARMEVELAFTEARGPPGGGDGGDRTACRLYILWFDATINMQVDQPVCDGTFAPPTQPIDDAFTRLGFTIGIPTNPEQLGRVSQALPLQNSAYPIPDTSAIDAHTRGVAPEPSPLYDVLLPADEDHDGTRDVRLGESPDAPSGDGRPVTYYARIVLDAMVNPLLCVASATGHLDATLTRHADAATPPHPGETISVSRKIALALPSEWLLAVGACASPDHTRAAPAIMGLDAPATPPETRLALLLVSVAADHVTRDPIRPDHDSPALAQEPKASPRLTNGPAPPTGPDALAGSGHTPAPRASTLKEGATASTGATSSNAPGQKLGGASAQARFADQTWRATVLSPDMQPTAPPHDDTMDRASRADPGAPPRANPVARVISPIQLSPAHGAPLSPPDASRDAPVAGAPTGTLSSAAPARPAPVAQPLALIALAALGAALAAGAAWALGAWAGFSRISSSGLLEHATRRAIYDLLRAQPGRTAQEIASALDLGLVNTRYHLDKLGRASLVAARRVRRRARYYVPGTMADLDAAETTAAPFAREIVDTVGRNPGLTLAELSRQLGASAPRCHYHVRNLVKSQVLAAHGEGRGKTYRLSDDRPAPTSPANAGAAADVG